MAINSVCTSRSPLKLDNSLPRIMVSRKSDAVILVTKNRGNNYFEGTVLQGETTRGYSIGWSGEFYGYDQLDNFEGVLSLSNKD